MSRKLILSMIETGQASFDIESGYSDLDWLVLQDNENRLLAYSIKAGKLVQRFFGSRAAINPLKNLIVVENYPGELTLYDLNTGDPLNRLIIDGETAFLKFALDGRRLFVLSSEQTVYAFDVNKLAVAAVR